MFATLLEKELLFKFTDPQLGKLFVFK